MNHNGLTSMMTVALRKCDRKLCEDGGAITFGGFDNKNCKPGIQWVQAIKGSTRWVFHLDLIRLNGRFLPSSYRVSADADTGNSYIQFSRKMIPTVARLLKAKKQGFYYTTDCNAKFTLGFVIRKKNFEVTEKHLLLNQQINGKCVLAIAEYPSIENFVVLGSAFHRAVCVTYEVQRGKLGFTPTVDQ
ncbi:Aspartic protease [Aphelenchoides besseyi]|nr:Aspartic protease [Aphelenchoides besseyi]